ncbi:hypothetical protein [Pseudonocardia adelaidensis]|uniref:ATP-binding cassette subfamily B protein n=1 Tax=Pseudonocardia adelaidensis TaxID=648754 RepID=A0ABP9P905_9PSEU
MVFQDPLRWPVHAENNVRIGRLDHPDPGGARLADAAARSGAAGDRITVLVTHRLANVRHADQILVLERGRLIEHGTHEQLIARRGTYHELFTLQASAYTGEGDARDTVPA